MYRCFASRGVGNDFLEFLLCISKCKDLKDGLTYQVVENTFIELPFRWSALPELLIVVVKASPVLAEFLQAVLINVFDPIEQEALAAITKDPFNRFFVPASENI
jgi:hypothetical protein